MKNVVRCCPREMFSVDGLVLKAAIQPFHVHSATHGICQKNDFLSSTQHVGVGGISWHGVRPVTRRDMRCI